MAAQLSSAHVSEHLLFYDFKKNIELGVYELHKADTGAIRFKVRYPMGLGGAAFTLTSKKDPTKDLYQVVFGPTHTFIDITQNATKGFILTEPIGSDFKEFWLTWHSNVICLGVVEQSEPLFIYNDVRIMTHNIGFIKSNVRSSRWIVEWIFEESPVILKPPKEKTIESGYLHWESLGDNNQIPEDALIGGFESEPLYIIRAMHNASLCPGKYIRSLECGYVPWGGREFMKPSGFRQILCGYNAKWIKTQGNFIPENALVAGYSEVRGEPLYIGRAMVNSYLLVGKVHTLYSKCYLPYRGKEIEVGEYEILVSAETNPRAVF